MKDSVQHRSARWASASAAALCALAFSGIAFAKLPPPTPEAAAKAAEAAARSAWAGKVDNYKLCLAQDRVASHYRKTTPSAKPAAAGPAACADPGPFVYTPPAPKPVESAGAASAPGAAGSPAGAAAPQPAPAPKS